MNAIRSALQRQVFQQDDERLNAVVNLLKVDGKKKKRPVYLCLALTIEHPISVRLYFVKTERGEKEEYRKRDKFNLRDVRLVDGINPRKPLPEFNMTISDRFYRLTAQNTEEKDAFITQLYKLSVKYLPVQMPDFSNVRLPVDEPASASIIPIEANDENVAETINDYQPITAKEEADFRRLLATAELGIGDMSRFSELLSEQLQSLDGANIDSLMGSEAAVNHLLKLVDGALDHVSHLEDHVDSCDKILAHVRNSVELIEEKDSLSVVERKNKLRLQEDLKTYVSKLDILTDRHLQVLSEANISDPTSISRCSEAARAVSQFVHSNIPKPLLNMEAYSEKAKKLEVLDLFVDRLMSHLSALFENLNALTETQDWGKLALPKHSQRFRALNPLSDLMSWLKTTRPNFYHTAIQRYVDATKMLYKRDFERFFDVLIGEVQRLGTQDKRATLSNQARQSFEPAFGESEKQYSMLIETVLGELGPVVELEQKFCVRFFHINSETLGQLETQSTGSGDSGGVGGHRNLEKHLNEQVRAVMTPLFESLNPHLERFVAACYKQNPSNVMLLFVIMSKKVLSSQDTGSYFSVTFGSLVVIIKRKFDAYMEMECQQLSDVKVPKRMRIGVLPTIERFGDFVRYAEKVFVDAERRTDVERHYERLCRATMEGIQRAAVSPNSKSPALIVKAENYHQLYQTLSELKLPCLDSLRKETKKEKESAIDQYVQEHLGRPLEKIHIFFENVQRAIDNKMRTDEVQIHPQFSRQELKKVVAMYPGKEVKKGLVELYRKVEKHLTEESSLLQVVWRNMQDQFIKQLQFYQQLIAECYPNAKVELEVSIQDVLQYFSEIAQQH